MFKIIVTLFGIFLSTEHIFEIPIIIYNQL